MEAGDTYCMIAELGHDVLHRLLVLFQQRGQLLVFLEQGVVLDDSVRILSFELRLECLCSTRSDEQERTQHGTRTCSPFETSTLTRRSEHPLATFSASAYTSLLA